MTSRGRSIFFCDSVYSTVHSCLYTLSNCHLVLFCTTSYLPFHYCSFTEVSEIYTNVQFALNALQEAALKQILRAESFL